MLGKMGGRNTGCDGKGPGRIGGYVPFKIPIGLLQVIGQGKNKEGPSRIGRAENGTKRKRENSAPDGISRDEIRFSQEDEERFVKDSGHLGFHGLSHHIQNVTQIEGLADKKIEAILVHFALAHLRPPSCNHSYGRIRAYLFNHPADLPP